jgi:NAD(P)-dependent dehydrogenase (short-subunit alcohol dehydrogenase family)
MALLSDKVCVITGGAGSVGLATARLFLDEGAKITLVDLKEDDLRRAAAELHSPNVDVVAADVSQVEATKTYFAKTVAKWGKIDVLFSNAGNQGVVAPFTDYPDDIFDSVIAVHIRGAFLACKYGIPHMNDGGSVIITSSIVGTRAGAGGAIAYVTAKHGQIGVMRSVAREAARRNIRVNTVHPGPIDNEFQLRIEQGISKLFNIDATKVINQMMPLQRHARPEEIAKSVLYLASDMSTFTTGSTLMVDGGASS